MFVCECSCNIAESCLLHSRLLHIDVNLLLSSSTPACRSSRTDSTLIAPTSLTIINQTYCFTLVQIKKRLPVTYWNLMTYNKGKSDDDNAFFSTVS